MQAGAHALAIPNAFALAVARPLRPAQPAGDAHPEPVAERDCRPQRCALNAFLPVATQPARWPFLENCDLAFTIRTPGGRPPESRAVRLPRWPAGAVLDGNRGG